MASPAGNGNSVDARNELISEADRAHLSGYLSLHVLDELAAVLAGLPLEIGRDLLRVVRVEAEGFGDYALTLALARVAHDHDPPPSTRSDS